MRYQNAPRKNVHDTPGAPSGRKAVTPTVQSSLGSPRRAALAGVLLSVVSAFALSPGCKSYSTCEDTKTCPDEEPSGDGDGGGQGGMGGTQTNTGVSPCTESEIECDGDCINPDTSVNFCGATGSCRGDNSGTTCDADEICVDGTCQLDCAEGLVLCDDTCIDPLTNDDYCGATDACTGAVTCGENLECVGGECFGWSEVDTVNFGEQNFLDLRSVIDERGRATVILLRENSSGERHLYSSDLFPNSIQWSTPSRIDSAAPSVTAFDFGMNSSGDAVLAWIQAPDGDTSAEVWRATRNAEGIWSNSESLSNGNLSAAGTPAVSIDSEGNAYVAWSETAVETFVRSVWTTRRPTSEGSWTQLPPTELPTSPPNQINLVPTADGEVLRLVGAGSGSITKIYLALSDQGVFDDPEELLGNLFRMQVTSTAGDGQNIAAIAGVVPGYMSATQEVWWAEYSAGEPTTAYSLIPGALPSNVTTAHAVLDSTGRKTIAYCDDRGGETKLRVFTSDSSEQAEEIVASPTAGVTGVRVGLAVDGLDNHQLAWTFPSSDPIWIARRRAHEDGWGEPESMGNFPAGAGSLSVHFNASGQGILTWIHSSSLSDTLGFAYFGPQTPVEE